jgi:hypothetical protein
MKMQSSITIDELLQEVTKMFTEIAPKIQAAISIAHEAYYRFLDENPEFLEQVRLFFIYLKHLPEQQRKAWISAAEYGWYINEAIPILSLCEVSKDKNALDRFMIEHIEENWGFITENILNAYPYRRRILECAFQLHIEERYIASIPLMISQADGICAESIGHHLFTDREERESKLKELATNADSFIGILSEIFAQRTQFSAGISKYSASKKALAPNRNGILHGSHRHLDYGTKINSLKSLSLLSFVVFFLNEKAK